MSGLSSKYSPKILDHAKQSVIDSLNTALKRVIQKRAEATDDLIGNKIASWIMKVSEKSRQKNSETVRNENDKELLKERYIYVYIYWEERQKIINVLRLI